MDTATEIRECENCQPDSFDDAVDTMVDVFSGDLEPDAKLCIPHVDLLKEETENWMVQKYFRINGHKKVLVEREPLKSVIRQMDYILSGGDVYHPRYSPYLDKVIIEKIEQLPDNYFERWE